MRRKELKEIIFKVSEGTVETLTDFLLWYFFLLGSSIGKYGSRGVYEAFGEAEQALSEINYQSFKRAVDHLRKNRTIRWKKSKDKLEIAITKEGKQRIKNILPVYQAERAWDKKLYLVTYDIPENKHKIRDLLREYLKKIGCALLQESVWVTPYNPRATLRDFVLGKGLGEMILVSDLGREGSVGGESIQELVKRVYLLSKINEEYKDFLDKYSEGKFSKTEVNFSFLKILENDPQLPFEILPKDWQGEKAYLLFKKLT